MQARDQWIQTVNQLVVGSIPTFGAIQDIEVKGFSSIRTPRH